MTEHPGGHANPRRVKAASHDKPDVPEQPRGSHTGHERRAPELPQSAGWRSRDIIRAAALGVGVLALAVGIWEASTVLFTVFLGILSASRSRRASINCRVYGSRAESVRYS
jgi:hypothetical protein